MLQPALAQDAQIPSRVPSLANNEFEEGRFRTKSEDTNAQRTGTAVEVSQERRKVAADAWHIAAGSAIIDGEVVVTAGNGTTDFSVLQNELKGKSTKIVLVASTCLSQRS
jgi:bifunctional non-homologous end joining protein LigD